MDQDIINNYKEQAQTAQQLAGEYEKLANKYSLQRLIIFGVLVFSIYLSVEIDNIRIFAGCVFIAIFWFAWLVKQQGKYDELKKYHNDLKTIIENEIQNILKHDNIYCNGVAFSNDKHFYTGDLDIFGEGSLFQFVNRAASSSGIHKLATWLHKNSDKHIIEQRQDAIKEIAAKPNWKLDLQTRLHFGLKQPMNQIKNLVSYLKTPVTLKNSKGFWRYSQVSPYLILGLLILSFFYPEARYTTGILMFLNYRLVAYRSKTVKMTDLIAGRIGQSLTLYSLAFECLEKEEWQTPYTKKLALKIKIGERSVSGQIKELGKLVDKLNYRLNWIVGILMNIIFIWDIRQVIAIEHWKEQNQQSLETAFDVLAEFEALISLSSLAINYPEWTFPQIADGDAYTIAAKNIAHPLIIKNPVKNDYELDNSFNIDIITGSNMAGKSTFLRTIGINTVLALSGAPVCADEMTVSVIIIISYMRIKDSLNESTSTFKAELDRLQMLLAAVENEPKVFFLIDEMLRGTNSVDKYLGSKAVIEQLISKKGVGMVATHDLQIAHLEQKYPEYVRNFYFDIQVKDGEMLFDYKMKHGECKTFNASLLLKQIGINVEAE
jgi:hypothetical protein